MTASHVAVPIHIRDLSIEDIPWIGWSGGPDHPASVAAALDRAAAGEVEYLAVCGPAGLPLSIGGVDFAIHPDGGTLWQLATFPGLQSCGLGTALIAAAEERIRGRGLGVAYLSVEADNHRAADLYSRLGFRPYGTEEDSWYVRDEAGRKVKHVATCTLMNKRL